MFQPDVVYAPIKDVSNCVVVVLEVACMICNSRSHATATLFGCTIPFYYYLWLIGGSWPGAHLTRPRRGFIFVRSPSC